MSKTKPTPGPWVIDPLNLGTPWNIGTVNGASVAMAFQLEDDPIAGQPKRTANARLLAAAPELLAALREFARMVCDDEILVTNEHGDTLIAAFGAANTAIAKADGR